jgi:hypothetical protein
MDRSGSKEYFSVMEACSLDRASFAILVSSAVSQT